MKKVITHPKLYYDFKILNNKTKLFYYGNQFSNNGKRSSQFLTLKSNFFSQKELIKLNKSEYENLKIYIIRQEKVRQVYNKKRQFDKEDIVKNSLLIMYNFKLEFKAWFKVQNTQSEALKL